MYYSKSKYIFLIFFFWLHEYVNAEAYRYYPSIDKYYKFHRNARDWFSARELCRSEGAVLAMPKNSDEAAMMVDYFNRHYPESFLSDIFYRDYLFVGFHDHFHENEFVTLKGEPLQYYFHKWLSGQPDDAYNEDCVGLHRTALLNDLPCHHPGVFMCEKPGKFDEVQPKIFNQFTSDPAYKCHPSLDMCYKIHLNPQTWPVARLVCHSEGGRLAIIKNKTTEDFLVSIFNDPGNYVENLLAPHYVLVGFHDLFEEEAFVTVLDERIDHYGYVNWGKGEPDDFDYNEDCGSMRRDGGINDFPCDVAALYICERPNHRYKYSYMVNVKLDE